MIPKVPESPSLSHEDRCTLEIFKTNSECNLILYCATGEAPPTRSVPPERRDYFFGVSLPLGTAWALPNRPQTGFRPIAHIGCTGLPTVGSANDRCDILFGRSITYGRLRQRDLDHQQFHLIHSKYSICRYQRHPLCLSLSNNQSVKRIAVM
jgi:hypothetical protein